MNLKALTQPPALTTIFCAMAVAGLYVGDNWTRCVMIVAALAGAIVALIRLKKQDTATRATRSEQTDPR